MKYIILIFICFFNFSFAANIVQNDDAKTAFVYLNKIRQNPDSYSKEIGVDLSDVSPIHQLRWNDTLALVAEERAQDMADRNYCAHVDPEGYGVNYKINKAGYKLNKLFLEDKSANFFESIGCGHENGIELIKELIIDRNTPDLGHRYHLLGIGDWDKNLYEIGIGFVKAKNAEYISYASIIIAKHDF